MLKQHFLKIADNLKAPLFFPKCISWWMPLRLVVSWYMGQIQCPPVPSPVWMALSVPPGEAMKDPDYIPQRLSLPAASAQNARCKACWSGRPQVFGWPRGVVRVLQTFPCEAESAVCAVEAFACYSVSLEAAVLDQPANLSLNMALFNSVMHVKRCMSLHSSPSRCARMRARPHTHTEPLGKCTMYLHIVERWEPTSNPNLQHVESMYTLIKSLLKSISTTIPCTTHTVLVPGHQVQSHMIWGLLHLSCLVVTK